MTKYDEAFKLRVVRQYLRGDAGLRAVAKRHGIDHGLVSRWAAAYDKHGVAGIRKKHSVYSAEFKLSVLKCMWSERLSIKQTCARFDLREPTSVSRWQRQYHEGGIHALEPRPKGRRPSVMPPISPSAPAPKENDTRTREELLEELEYLRAENAYLKKLDALLKQKEQGQHQTGQKKKHK